VPGGAEDAEESAESLEQCACDRFCVDAPERECQEQFKGLVIFKPSDPGSPESIAKPLSTTGLRRAFLHSAPLKA
jgi:hypothetical protein